MISQYHEISAGSGADDIAGRRMGVCDVMGPGRQTRLEDEYSAGVVRMSGGRFAALRLGMSIQKS